MLRRDVILNLVDTDITVQTVFPSGTILGWDKYPALNSPRFT